MVKPNLFIVGAPKCGTTSLHEYLQGHPDIFMSLKKEVFYFPTDTPSPIRPDYVTKDWYLSHFKYWSGEKYVGESTPYYLYSTEAAKKIKQFSPDAKIIIMLRNPIDRAYSHYCEQYFFTKRETRSFSDALATESQLRQGEQTSPQYTRGLLYVENGRYSEYVTSYFAEFGRENAYIIIFDDFIRDTPSTYKKLLNYLAIDDTYQPLFTASNSSKQLRNLHAQTIFFAIRRLYLATRPITYHLVPIKLRHTIVQRFHRWNAKPYTAPPMPVDIRIQLANTFKPEIDTLSHLLDRDLTHWYNV